MENKIQKSKDEIDVLYKASNEIKNLGLTLDKTQQKSHIKLMP